MSDLFVAVMLVVGGISFLAMWFAIADANERMVNPCNRRANASNEGVLVVMFLAIASFLITAGVLL